MSIMTFNIILRRIILSGVFILPFLPFVVSTSLFFPFITGKGFAFRIIVEIIFACWLILAISNPAYRPRRSGILVALGVFLAVIGIADIFSENPVKSFWSNYERMEGWILLAHLFAYFLTLVSVLKTEKLWNYFWNTTLVASLTLSCIGFFQMAGLVAVNQGSTRLDAYVGNSTYLAVYLLFHIFLALFFLVRQTYENKTWRWFYGVVALLDLIILYYTATRGAILGLIGGVLVSAVFISVFEKERKTLRKVSISVLVGVVAFVGIFFALKDSSFVAQNQVLSRFKPSSLVSAAETRTSVWKIAIEGVKERPVLGWGQESFNYVFNKYYEPSLFGEEQWFDRTHNIIFDWLIAGGILGLISYLAILFVFVRSVWKTSDFSLTGKAILFGLISAYFFQNLFVFDNLLSYFMFFSLLGYIHFKNTENPNRETNILLEEVKEMSYITIVPVALLLIFSLYVLSVRPILANNALIKSFIALGSGPNGPDEGYVMLQKALAYNSPLGRIEIREQSAQVGSEVSGSQNVDQKTKQKFFELGKKTLEDQIAETPGDIRHYVLLASYLNSFGFHDEAINLLEKSLTLSPQKQIIYFELATSYINKKDYQKALGMFKSAYDLAPQFTNVQVLYALGALYAGEQDLVDELFAKIDRRTIVFDNRFVQAYQTLGNFREIAKIFEERIVEEPANHSFHLSLAATYMELGRRNDAIKELEAVVQYAPNEDIKKQAEFYIAEIKAGRNP